MILEAYSLDSNELIEAGESKEIIDFAIDGPTFYLAIDQKNIWGCHWWFKTTSIHPTSKRLFRRTSKSCWSTTETKVFIEILTRIMFFLFVNKLVMVFIMDEFVV